MNKNFSKQVETASRKHEKGSSYKNKHSFMAGAEFVDKNSPKQFTEKDLFQMLNDGIANFAFENKLEMNNTKIKKWFKDYLKK